MVCSRWTRWLAPAALLLSALVPAAARADWTTYRADAARSGVDSSSVGSLPFASAWSSQNLGGNIWAEPLVYHGLVIVATEGNRTAAGEAPAQVVALNESTGQVAWRANAGTPVPASDLPCGDISPTVGITSTPVIDPATNRVFAVADTLNGSTITHELFAFDATTGAPVPGYPVSVEPPGDVPADQLQRAALALDGGEVIVGYGGNDGDCGTYHGWLVGASENGGGQHTFQVPASEAAIWGSGNGPAVDSAGNIFTATGNSNPGAGYGFQESVLEFTPNLGTPIGHWAPSNWPSLDSGDTDLGSSGPLLLPGGLAFEIGKQGVGYVLNASHLGGTGAAPAYQAPVCSSSFGGAAYFGGVIYVACSNGLRALTLNPSVPSFSPLWQGPSAVIGPPIVSGGLVWATDWSHATLYGLNLQSGKVAVMQSTPSMEHFAIPAASDGKLFLATGQTVEAYTIANPAPAQTTPAAPTPSTPSGSTPAAPPRNRCTIKLRSHRVKIHHGRQRRPRTKKPTTFGTVTLSAKCTHAAKVSLTGAITEKLGKRSGQGKPKRKTFRLATVHATLKAGAAKAMQMRLPASLVLALERHAPESGTFTLAAGAARARVRARLRL